MSRRVWLFAAKETADGFYSFRVPASLVLILVLFTSVSFTLAEHYLDTSGEYQKRVEQNEAALKQTQTYSAITVPIEKPPTPLMLLNIGLSENISNSFNITRLGYPTIANVSQTSGSLLQVFPSFDLSLVIQIVFGLIALVFSYSGIAGEKEQGTLKLVCSTPYLAGRSCSEKSSATSCSLKPCSPSGSACSCSLCVSSPGSIWPPTPGFALDGFSLRPRFIQRLFT